MGEIMKNSFSKVGFFSLFLVIVIAITNIGNQTTLARGPEFIDIPWVSPPGFSDLIPGKAYSDKSILALWDEENLVKGISALIQKGEFTDKPVQENKFPLGIPSYIQTLIIKLVVKHKKTGSKFESKEAFEFFADLLKNSGGFTDGKSKDKYTLLLKNKTPFIKTGSKKGIVCGRSLITIVVNPPVKTESAITFGVGAVNAIIKSIKAIFTKYNINVGIPEPAGADWPQPNSGQFPASGNWGYEKVFTTPTSTPVIPITDSISKVRVAVLDTGINAKWPVAKETFLDDSWIGVSKSFEPFSIPTSHNGHGTGVAGIISGSPSGSTNIGVTWSSSGAAAQLSDLRVCNENETNPCRTESIVERICFAASSTNSDRADIINLSLGGALSSTIMQGAIIDAINAGVLVIAAAGNSNQSSKLNKSGKSNIPVYPAALSPVTGASSIFTAGANDGFISVGSTSLDPSGSPSNTYSGTSTHNEYVSLSAPGDQILTYDKLGNAVLFNGTSFSTAYVSGAAAVAISHYINLHKTAGNPIPKPTPALLEKWLVEGAKTQPITSASCKANDCGAGVVNIPKTLSIIP
jgi:hypothetical protein